MFSAIGWLLNLARPQNATVTGVDHREADNARQLELVTVHGSKN
jgi:hypothetical protein